MKQTHLKIFFLSFLLFSLSALSFLSSDQPATVDNITKSSIWNTFLGAAGGSGFAEGDAIALDSSGNSYVAGTSNGSWGTPIRAFSGSYDAFVAKFNGNGALLWNTFLGGTGSERGYALALGPGGNVCVAGSSSATWGSPVRPYSGSGDSFVAMLDANGALQWNEFLGGSGSDSAYALAIDTGWNVYVAGSSSATWGSPFKLHAGSSDGFAAKLSGGGTLQWNTFIGGSGLDVGYALALDTNGNLYLAGSSNANWGIPVRAFSGSNDGFAAKLNSGGILQWHTFLGGSSDDFGRGIAVDTTGNTYIAGYGNAAWGSPDRNYSGGSDAFAARLDKNGALQWNTFLGGAEDDRAYAIARDASANIFISGLSNASWGAPVSPFSGRTDILGARLDGTGDLKWHGFMGGSGDDIGRALAADANENIFMTGDSTSSWGSPIRPFVGNTAAFVSKMSEATPPAIGLSRNTLNFGATIAMIATKTQSVIVSNTGGGTLSWTASSDQSWLSVSPTSGSGTTVIQVSVNHAGLANGSHTGKISISAPGAVNSPKDITVGLTVIPAVKLGVPFGEFATPIDGAEGVTGAIPVTGWVLDDVEVTKIDIKRDPHPDDPAGAIGPDGLVYIGDGIFVEGARPDVEAAYPTLPLNYRAGWGYMLLTNFLPAQGNGTFKLYAYATDKEGFQVLLGTKTICCTNAVAVKPFGTIDTPAQGGDASGNPFFVCFGWVLSPLPKTIPIDGSTISVWVDGAWVGELDEEPNAYNLFRPDVAGAFPGLNNSGGPVGAFYIDMSIYTDGVHTIFWISTDNLGQADGIGSRYFNVRKGEPAPPAVLSRHREERSDVAITSQFSHCEPLGVAIPHIDSILNLPPSFTPLSVKRGFNLNAPPEIITPDNFGSVHIKITEVELIEIDLGKGSACLGYQIVGGELRPLPIGSTLSNRVHKPPSNEPVSTKRNMYPSNWTFAWLPGPGFLGTYELVFVVKDGSGSMRRISLNVKIVPKTGEIATSSRSRVMARNDTQISR